MHASIAGLLLFQVALIAPNGPDAGDLLPATLGEWHTAKTEKFSSVEVGVFAPPADADALAEFGFLSAERRQYQQGSKHFTVEAVRMKDPTAAFGAFTWFRRATWREEPSVPSDPRSFDAAIAPGEAVVIRNRYFLHITGETPSHQELASLAAALPSMTNEPMPAIGTFFPTDGLQRSTVRYASGPSVFAKLAPRVPPAAVGFDIGAEVETAEYHLPGKAPMTLALLYYPTPQIARVAAGKLEALNLATVYFRRNGSLITLVPDASRKADAEQLFDRVPYQMSIIWNQGMLKGDELTVGQMLTSIFQLCGILLVFCFLSGLVYGVIRVIARRMYPGTIFDRDVEVIELRLND